MSKVIISSGLKTSGSIVSSGMSMYVLSGGSLTGGTVNFGGELYISNGGYASKTTMSQNASMRVGYGGSATSITIAGSQAKLAVSGTARWVSASGASASNVSITVEGLLQSGTLATSGGVMTVLENGVVSGVNVYSSSLLNISSGGRGVYVSLGNRGSAVVHSGGYVTNAYISSGGQMVISEGGDAYNAVLKSGANLHVHRGGSAYINWSVGQGTISLAPGAEVSYMYSSTFQGVVQCDHSGNITSNTSVAGGSIIGSMYVFNGGSVSGVSVESGGTLEVWSGGTATNVMWTPGAGNLRVYEGGTITFRQKYTGVYVSDFSAADVKHTASASLVDSGGKAYVMNGGVLQSGSVSYAAAFVWSGGMVKDMSIAHKSFITVSDGGVAFRNQVWGAELLVFSGGVAHETTVANVSKGCIVVFSGGNANNTVISGTSGNLGSCIISSGGVANRVSAHQGKVIVHTSGVVHSAHLESSAVALISGGLANSSYVRSNSELYVYDSGLALDTVASNGAVHVSAGGICRTELNEYSTLNIWENGSAYATTVNYGDLNVYDSGTAYNNTVNSDGALYVWSGGSASGNAVTGGEVTIWNGGEVRNTVLNERADLYIWDGGKHTGTLTVSADSEVYADSGSVIDFTLVGRTASDGFLINDLSRIDGSPDYSITVSYSQTDGIYKLAQNAGGLYSVSLYNDGGYKLGDLIVNGEALVYDDVAYSLSLQAGNLTLNQQDLTLKVTAVVSTAPQNLHGSSDGISWDPLVGASSYVVEYSSDNFKTVAAFETSKCSVDTFELPAGPFEWRVRASQSSVWANGPVVAGTPSETAQQIVSDGDGNDDIFFANSSGIWGRGFAAEHHGDGIWEGTSDTVLLKGKNKIANLFEGTTDTNVLVLTDDANGDALFVDDIFTELGSKDRFANIDEIRAGAGDDIVDMTTKRYSCSGADIRIYGGNGNDTIWGSTANNKLFGDAGNDSLIGASGDDLIVGGSGDDTMHGGGGNDVFTFGSSWGNDSVVQLAGDSVTLWFESGSNSNWNGTTLTYTDGSNSVTVTGTENVTLKFGNISGFEEAFEDSASRKIFEEKALLA